MIVDKVVPCKDMNLHECITDLLIALLGETSFFFKLNANGSKMVAVEANIVHLPLIIALKVEKFADIATNVRNVEFWRKDFSGVDAIKRAFIESLCEAFDDFLNAVDTIRMNHISHISEMSCEEILAFVMTWHSRIYYIYRLTEITRQKCGTDIMNTVYREWSVESLADWTLNLLENSLKRMSSAFHRFFCHWLQDGKLPSSSSNWMFRDVHQASVMDSTTTTAKAASIRNLNAKNLQQLSASPISSFPSKSSLIATKRGGLSLHDRLEIDWTHVPFAFSGCKALIRKIFNIGKNVCVLREYHHQKFYEYRLEERMKLLEDKNFDASKVWYNATERGRFYAIIQRYADIVGEDVMNEVMQRQRLLDHIAFVQRHFLLLHGDFSMGIYEAIRETSIATVAGGTRISSHKLDSMVQECVCYALNYTSPDKAFVGLGANLVVGDATVSAISAANTTLANAAASSTTEGNVADVTGSGGVAISDEKSRYKSSHKVSLRRAINRAGTAEGIFLEDLVRIHYRAPGLVSEVLSPHLLKVYCRIFDTFIPFRILHCRANESVLRLSDAVRSFALSQKIRKNVKSTFEINNSAIRFAQYTVANVQRFATTLLSYVFEVVLDTECSRSLSTLRAQSDLPSLNAVHSEFLIVISMALFLHRSTLSVVEVLRQCVKTARRVLRRVDNFFTAQIQHQADVVHKMSYEEAESEDEASLRKAEEKKNEANLWAERRVNLAEVYVEFTSWTLKLHTLIAQIRRGGIASTTDGAETKYSLYWHQFAPARLLVPQNLLNSSTSGLSDNSLIGNSAGKINK